MSGIAGILSPQANSIIQTTLDKIKHRGSQPAGLWENHRSSLGAVRLADLDEHPGPITTPSGERAIVWDGRLANREAITNNLEFHTLDSSNDAEVVLHGFEELGHKIFSLIEGDFALAIADGDRMLLARDRLGARPLYYGFQNGDLCFASEIKALIRLVEAVYEFPPGHFLDSQVGLYPVSPYIPDPVALNGAQDSASNLATYLREAVGRSIPQGVKVGVWLSGGVDSSVIAALARPFVDELYTFSAGVEGAPDLEYARIVADHIGAKYYERIYTRAEMVNVLEKVIFALESFDAPLVHSTISNYLVSELASETVPFVLSGEGGDELFAGYAYQKDFQSEIELTLSIQEAIAALHNTALQRVDRSASAHGCGVATPFLDPNVVRYALAIPARWKIRGSQPVDKWPLRQGLVDTLPEEVIWRGKSKFWEGSGTGKLMSSYAAEKVSDRDFERGRDLPNGDQLRSKEDFLYYRIFTSCFGDKVPLDEIGRTQHI
jgi:asparagine synthase (glutamine-hydrolysing)